MNHRTRTNLLAQIAYELPQFPFGLLFWMECQIPLVRVQLVASLQALQIMIWLLLIVEFLSTHVN